MKRKIINLVSLCFVEKKISLPPKEIFSMEEAKKQELISPHPQPIFYLLNKISCYYFHFYVTIKRNFSF